MHICGLTGGTGSGKTEAAKRFAELGIPVIDADRIGHELIAPGGAAEEAVLAAFGPSCRVGGRIDRGRLGALVFSDAAALERLNAITRPLLEQEIHARCAALAARDHRLVIVDAAILAEDGRKPAGFDGLIVVACARAKRLRRLVEQRGLTPDEAERRMDSQTPLEKKLAAADWVIENEGTLAELHRRVDAVAGELRRHAAAGRRRTGHCASPAGSAEGS